jgi:hypothetical protein
MTHNLHLLIASERSREIERRAELARRIGSGRRRTRLKPEALNAAAHLAIRMAGPDDGVAIERLSQLEGRATPSLPLILAEVDGRVVAALSFDGRVALADPFRPTARVLELLRMRAAQLRGTAPRRGRLRGLRATLGSAFAWSQRSAGQAAAVPGPPDSGPSLVR